MRARLAVILGGACLVALLAGASPAAAQEVRLPLAPIGSFAEARSVTVEQGSGDILVTDGRNERQRITVAGTAGKFKLKFNGEERELNFNAGTGAVETALNEIVCSGASCMSVSGGPGDATGSKPYEMIFGGAAAATTDVPQLVCESGTPPLSGGSPSSSCTVTTTVNGVNGQVVRYHADGTPSNFSGLGTNVIDARKGSGGKPCGEEPASCDVPTAPAPEGLHFLTPNLTQVAVDESAAGAAKGDIYVTQPKNNLVDTFAASGAFLGQLDEYEETPGNEATLKPFALSCGVTVDGSGALYVGDANKNLIHKYVPSANPVKGTDSIANFSGVPVGFPQASSPCALAAGAGSLFDVRAVGQQELFKLDATTGAVLYKVNERNTTVTVDPGTGHVLTATGSEVREYDASGGGSPTFLHSFGAGSAVGGIAVSKANDDLYLSRSGITHLDVYGPFVVLPDVSTLAPSEVGGASATLRGTINAAGEPNTTCHFEYLPEATYNSQKAAALVALEPPTVAAGDAGFAGAQSAPCVPPGPFEGSSVAPVSAHVTGLAAETKYVYRLVGENANGKIGSEPPQPFETFGKPIVAGGSASEATATTAKVSGEVNSRGVETETAVEYVTKAQFDASGFTGASEAIGPVVAAQITGNGDLSAATGSGNLTSGSTLVASLATATGKFEAGQAIEGTGISAGTTVASVGETTLTLSAPATATNAGVALSAASKRVTNLSTATGTFVAGQAITGTGIAAGTTIASVGAKELVLSKAPTERALGTTLTATGFQPVMITLTGLQEGTAYRFRLAAESEAGPAAPGPTGSFTTILPLSAPSALLPDGRAWELVSPAQKQGGEAFALYPGEGSGAQCPLGGALNTCKPGFNVTAAPSLSSADGEGLVYQGFPFSSSAGAAIANEYLSHRTPGGWQTTILAPAQMTGSFAGFDPTLGKGVLFEEAPSLGGGAPSEYANVYTQPSAAPESLTALITEAPENRDTETFKTPYAGASDDLSHVFFEANDALTGPTPFAPEASDFGAAKSNLYESFGGQLRLVNVLPGGTSVPGHFGAKQVSDLPHAISADGRAAFWSDEGGQLYARIQGQGTVEVKDPGAYLTASEDGSQVLLKDGCLYELETEACVDLTEDESAVHKGGFQGIAGASEDLSRIYFVDTAVLAKNEGAGLDAEGKAQRAVAGQMNLYSWSEGQSSFVAGLEDGEFSVKAWAPIPIERTAEASRSGRWLAFISLAALTGYDNSGPTCLVDNHGSYEAGRCREAFLFDAATGTLTCASCNPSGAHPIGPTRLPVSGFAGGEDYLAQSRYLTNSGRLYFDSQDALSLLDTNHAVEGPNGTNGEPSGAGAAGAEDVYQYEPQGVGDCAKAGGCVALLSSGREPQDSNFLAADESGKNVFFTTRDRLVASDRDELMDVYDAREGGGIEDQPPAVECKGEACQPPASVPASPSPSSLGFQGPGNIKGAAKKPHCAKGQHQVKNKGKTRCVKDKKAKQKHKRANRDRGADR